MYTVNAKLSLLLSAAPSVAATAIVSCHWPCCHHLACFSRLTPAPPLEPNLRGLEGRVGWGAWSRDCAGQGRKAALHIPQQKHCFLPASPQQQGSHGGYSAALLASFQCRHTSWVEDVWPFWAAAPNPVAYKPTVLLHAWQSALSLWTWGLHITLHASSQDPAKPARALRALLPGLKQLLSAPWAASCTSLSPKCPLAAQQHPPLTTELTPLPAVCSCPAQTSRPSCLWVQIPPSPFPLTHAQPHPLPSSDTLLFFRQM